MPDDHAFDPVFRIPGITPALEPNSESGLFSPAIRAFLHARQAGRARGRRRLRSAGHQRRWTGKATAVQTARSRTVAVPLTSQPGSEGPFSGSRPRRPLGSTTRGILTSAAQADLTRSAFDSLANVSSIRPTASSTSSSLVPKPRLKRIDDSASSPSRPMALRT